MANDIDLSESVFNNESDETNDDKILKQMKNQIQIVVKMKMNLI
jgi:hypothetical protein